MDVDIGRSPLVRKTILSAIVTPIHFVKRRNYRKEIRSHAKILNLHTAATQTIAGKYLAGECFQRSQVRHTTTASPAKNWDKMVKGRVWYMELSTNLQGKYEVAHVRDPYGRHGILPVGHTCIEQANSEGNPVKFEANGDHRQDE